MDKFKYYIEDCIEELISRSIKETKNADESDNEFDKGKSFAYYEILNFLLNQADVFQIKEELKESIRDFSPSF
ncbi:MAG: hypothetical protein ABIJ16_12620 [Bacteroidota bacterium]